MHTTSLPFKDAILVQHFPNHTYNLQSVKNGHESARKKRILDIRAPAKKTKFADDYYQILKPRKKGKNTPWHRHPDLVIPAHYRLHQTGMSE
ncbi:hypothetical protein L596_010559 [Steinernema carpocapsae]|uniref:Uncharacterized protein n=1 Tax=Steinernema carpocapsae TaxID=34508 RepID=A0A4U5PIX2_STECR|nr:hypothetical protein L596_010559 [Steinernema carpocapsae]